jgi:hypothetical protein
MKTNFFKQLLMAFVSDEGNDDMDGFSIDSNISFKTSKYLFMECEDILL